MTLAGLMLLTFYLLTLTLLFPGVIFQTLLQVLFSALFAFLVAVAVWMMLSASVSFLAVFGVTTLVFKILFF